MFERLRLEPDTLGNGDATGKIAEYNSKTRRRAYVRLLVDNGDFKEIEKLAGESNDQTRVYIINILGSRLSEYRMGDNEKILVVLSNIQKAHANTRVGRKVVQMLSNRLEFMSGHGDLYRRINEVLDKIAEDLGITDNNRIKGLLRRTQEQGLLAKQAA
ncbi:MAG TPA: hypothetical protein VI912_00275 [Candidatus Bilamarchaeaceae archaeon]|nr:hypothetical protein [Candidatus Bilamarchaeaceae archaeon]